MLTRLTRALALVSPDRIDWVSSCIEGLEGQDALSTLLAGDTLFAGAGFWLPKTDPRAVYQPYNVSNGLLTIPVKGMMLNNFGFQAGDMATGYQYIQAAMERGLEDKAVKGIALLVDSPGGEAAGAFDLTDRMHAMRGVKPIQAIVSEHAYSAAYAVASSADTISVSRTGGVGSIGVVWMHADHSEEMANQGIKVTFIFAGKHKVDGNPYQELSPSVKAKMQKGIDRIYDTFVGTVARNRGLDERAVRATEADTYGTAEAIEVGLADAEAPMDVALATFADSVKRRQGTAHMTETTIDTVARSDHDAAVQAAKNEGIALGVAQERERFAAVLGLEGVQHNMAVATKLAMTGMTAEQLEPLLALIPAPAAPVAAPVSAANHFAAAMEATGNPEVGASAQSDLSEDDHTVKSARILAAFSAASGRQLSR